MRKIGIDFDNTIISYDELFFERLSLTPFANATIQPHKNSIREYLRSCEDGELAWQALQLEVYGRHIDLAPVSKGFSNFLTNCIDQDIEIFVVSHKTRFAAQDHIQECDLIERAKSWLVAHSLVSDYGPIKSQNVFFEPTRSEKICRIREIGCEIFVDDLMEVFLDPIFPDNVKPILFDPHDKSSNVNGLTRVRSWHELKIKLRKR